MDQLNKKFLTDVLSILAILLVTIVLFWRYPLPSVLLAGGLAITIFVAADVVLLRRS